MPLGILSMEETMIAMVISELKSISRLKIFSRNWPLVCNLWSFNNQVVLFLKWSYFLCDLKPDSTVLGLEIYLLCVGGIYRRRPEERRISL